MRVKNKFAVLGSGQLGYHLAQELSLRECEVLSLSRSKQENTKGSWRFESVDLRELDRVRKILEKFKPDKLIVATGFGGIRECKQNSEESYHINVTNTLDILVLARVLDTASLVFSTSLIWDLERICSTNSEPRVVYAKQKKSMETLISEQSGDVTVFRLGKVIDHNSKIVTKIKAQLDGEGTVKFYKNLMMSPVHISSVVEYTSKWIEDSIRGQVNLVPKNQWSEGQLSSEVMERLGVESSALNLENLEIPEDELPITTGCPENATNVENAIYGPNAILKELGIKCYLDA